MINNTNEIEVKFAAPDVEPKAFCKWAMQFDPQRYERTKGTDVYYQREDKILRHRYQHTNSLQELTVKQRKSIYSTVDRIEIDLHLDRNSPEEVTQFLKLTGWSPIFTLHKDNHVFWINCAKDYTLVAAMYDVKLSTSNEYRKYIELEVAKGSKIGPPQAKFELKEWSKGLTSYLKIRNEPLNKSLYEIFIEET